MADSDFSAEATTAVPVPPGAYQLGKPLPDDKFVAIGRCPRTERDITLCYQTMGSPSDPCLILVSGLGSGYTIWRNEFCEALVAAGFYLVRFDNRDVGLSTHLDGVATANIVRFGLPSWMSVGEGEPPYTVEDMARDAWGLLTALKIEQAHVMGGSMGGMIVQCMAIQEPTRTLSLTILYSHSGGCNVKPQTFGMSLSMLDKPASDSVEDVVAFKVRNAARYTGDFELDEPYTKRMAEMNLQRAPDDKDGLLRQVWATQRAPSRVEGLKALAKAFPALPVLILHGMEDTMIPYENGVQLAKLMPGSRLVLFARMGHSVPGALYGAIVGELGLQKALAAK